MKTNGGSSRATDLIKLLQQMQSLYRRLLELVRAKVEAMRRADVHAMRDLNEEEASVVHRLRERDGLRRQLMDVVGAEVGLAKREGRSMAVAALASRMVESDRAELLAAADALKKTAMQTAWANRSARVATRDVLHHLQWVAASIRPRVEPPAGYSREGVTVSRSDTLLFDALG